MSKHKIRILSNLALPAIERPNGADGPAILTLPVLPEGEFEHPRYGTLSWTPEKFAAMERNFDAEVTGYAPMLNVDHATHNPFAAAAPAYGWPTELFHTPGKGLFCKVELTDLGVEAVEKKRYRYTSAEVTDHYVRSTGAAFSSVFCGLALTNTPFHDTMPGVFSVGAADGFCVLDAGAGPNADLVAQFVAQLTPTGPQAFAMADGELSFEDVRGRLHQALLAESGGEDDTDWDDYPSIEDVYPSFVIYRRGWEAPWWKRGYTLQGRTVVLDAEKTEVEWIWVEVARQSFAAACKQVRQGATAPRNPAEKPANERKSMSQDNKPKRNFGQVLWNALGFGKTVTQEEFTAALDSDSAPAAEPAEIPNDTTLSQPASAEVTVLRQQVEEQRKAFAKLQEERAAEQLALAKQQAETVIQGFVTQGKITPAMLSGDGGAALREFARAQPTAFAALYSAAPQLVPLNRLGRVDVPQGGDEGQGDTFLSRVGALTAKGLEFSAACDQVAAAEPKLYAAYQKANGRGGK